MVLSSKAKKEEAELRAIAKKAREVKKAAAARDRKAKERERRQRVKQGLPNEPRSASSEPKPRGRKGVIVLPSEAQEMTTRFGDGSKVTTASPASGKGKGKRAGKKGAAAVAAVAAAAEVAPAGSVEPPYRVEVHYKRKVLLVDVTLHRVPPHLISLDGTTDDTFMLNTGKYTKKFYLKIPYPQNIKVDASKAEYESEDGILHCVFPLKNEEIPEELTATRERIINDIRNQRALRFGTTTDGELTVRTRRALLAGNEKQQTALHDSNKKSKRSRVEGEEEAAEEGEPSAAADAAETTTTASPVEQASPKRKGDAKTVAAASNGAKPKKASKMEVTLDAAAARVGGAAAADEGNKAGKKGKKPAPVDENRAMMAIAREAGQKVQLALKDKLAAAQKLHAQRVERIQKRDTRKTSKKEKSQASFERIIGQLRQNVDTTEAQLTSKKSTTTKGKAAQSSSAPSKRVRFA